MMHTFLFHFEKRRWTGSGARVIIVPQSETVVSVSSPLAASSIGGVDLQSQLQKDGYDVKVIGVTSVDQALPYYFS